MLFYELLLRDILLVGRRCNFSFKFLEFKCLFGFLSEEGNIYMYVSRM